MTSVDACTRQFLTVLGISCLPFVASECLAQASQPEQSAFLAGAITRIDGPYNYKDAPDQIPLLGWIKERLSNGEANFLLCNSKIIKVKTSSLERVSRNCPGPSPIGPWVLHSNGQLVPLVEYTTDPKVFGGIEKKPITIKDLPDTYQMYFKNAKIGDWVALSYTSETGATKLGLIDKSGPQ